MTWCADGAEPLADHCKQIGGEPVADAYSGLGVEAELDVEVLAILLRETAERFGDELPVGCGRALPGEHPAQLVGALVGELQQAAQVIGRLRGIIRPAQRGFEPELQAEIGLDREIVQVVRDPPPLAFGGERR